MQGYEEHSIPAIPVEESYLLHTPENPFCPIDPSCPCHENPLLLQEVAGFGEQGLMTPQEATDFVNGKMI